MKRDRHAAGRGGRRRRGVLAWVFAALALAGCQTWEPLPVVTPTGDPLVDAQAWQRVAPAKDRVLWNFRVGAMALRLGDWTEARAQFDAGLRESAGILADAGAPAAARARGMFGAESQKPFAGEPYERAMANYYRGILYWAEGEPDNARAAFRNAQFIDSDTEEQRYAGDYVLLDYLDGYIATRLGGGGGEALARAQARSAFALPAYDPGANVMVFVEYGRGPRKVAEGADGERLAFRTKPSAAVRGELVVAGAVYPLPPYDDLHFQATTRGGRVMDYILGNKAVFKRGTEAVGDAALGAAVAVASDGRRGPPPRTKEERERQRENEREREQAAVALATVGIFSKIASAATRPAADTRTWDNLPQYLSFAALRLPPGRHEAGLEFFDEQDRRLPDLAQRFAIEVPEGGRGTAEDIVIFRTGLAR